MGFVVTSGPGIPDPLDDPSLLPEDWTEQGGQLTPSLKLKRSVVMKEQAAA